MKKKIMGIIVVIVIVLGIDIRIAIRLFLTNMCLLLMK